VGENNSVSNTSSAQRRRLVARVGLARLDKGEQRKRVRVRVKAGESPKLQEQEFLRFL